MKTYIYLISNIHNNIYKVYIGKTKNPRLREHNHKVNFGTNIIYIIIDEISSLKKEDWKPLECYWIEQFKVWGFNVQNKNKGGGGPEYYTEESKQKLRKPKPIGFSQKISVANKGKIRTEEHKIKYSLPKTEQHKQNISKARKGCTTSKKGKKYGPYPKLSKAKKGHSIFQNKERNKKISEAKKGQHNKGICIFDVKNNMFFESKIKCALYNGYNINKMRKLVDEGIDFKKITKIY